MEIVEDQQDRRLGGCRAHELRDRIEQREPLGVGIGAYLGRGLGEQLAELRYEPTKLVDAAHRDFPTPGSPPMNAVLNVASTARSQRSVSCASSSPRPTNGPAPVSAAG